MSKEPKDGGPAFPLYCGLPGQESLTEGISALDWFAGQAMTGIALAGGQAGQEAQQNPSRLAAWSYDVAEAMLEERIKRKRKSDLESELRTALSEITTTFIYGAQDPQDLIARLQPKMAAAQAILAKKSS